MNLLPYILIRIGSRVDITVNIIFKFDKESIKVKSEEKTEIISISSVSFNF
jgi:hypothetical protein